MIVISIILGILPSLIWLSFFLKEDRCPEPNKIIIRAFAAGSLVTLAAVAIQLHFQDRIIGYYGIGPYTPLAFTAFAFVEELLKFIAIYLSVRRSRYFDEPVDAMIYMIAGSLGFAMVENVAIAYNNAAASSVFEILILRFVGATLLHALSSGIVGYHWARGMIKLKEGRGIITGILIASVLHAVFNYLIIISNEEVIYPVLFLASAALIVFWDFEKIKKGRNEIKD